MDYDLDDDFELGDGETDEEDPLDAENFNPVDYINRNFPNEVSLTGLDDFVDRLKCQQQGIDSNIRHAIRRQAACGRRARTDLDEAQVAVRELFERIRTIKAKAEQSESLVSDVCRDIKSLDIAKRNLTLTVTALKRLVMLVTALDQLRSLAGNRQYREASGLIHAVEELAEHFQELSHVARVADLLERKASILGDLKAQLLQDYKSLLGSRQESSVEEASFCVDAMGPSMRREVIQQFCLGLLEEYMDHFQPPKPASALDTAERRYAWLNRKVREFDDKYKVHFPEAWRVPCGLCEQFCHVTRQHLVEVLGETHHSIDPELMVRVLRKSIEFENELAKKYPVEDAAPAAQPDGADYSGGASGFGFKYPGVLGKSSKPTKSGSAGSARAGQEEQFAPRFRGIISVCFDAYLVSWVQHEEKLILETLERNTAPGADTICGQGEGGDDDDDDGMEAPCLYNSAPELFSCMKQSMTRCADFSTSQTLFDVFHVFRKIISQYVDKLDGLLPKKVAMPLESQLIQGVCCVIGTSEYCDETLPQLQETLLRIIDSSYEERVTFLNEQDQLGSLVSRAMQVLVQSVERSLDDVFAKMTRTNWAQFNQDVGDQSAYVSEMSERLSLQFGPIGQYLSKIHYRFFCDKFVQAFVVRFISEIYRCRKINEQGAQQLLLDTSLIKETLLKTPVISSRHKQMPTAYSNYVLNQMGRAEAMLKVLSSPDVDAAAVSALLGGDRSSPESQSEIERLLALRASSDAEPEPLLDDEAAGGDASSVAGLSNMMKGAFGNAMNQKATTMGANASEDLKKLSGDVKKKLLGLGSWRGKS